jgi:hypothetical protein
MKKISLVFILTLLISSIVFGAVGKDSLNVKVEESKGARLPNAGEPSESFDNEPDSLIDTKDSPRFFENGKKMPPGTIRNSDSTFSSAGGQIIYDAQGNIIKVTPRIDKTPYYHYDKEKDILPYDDFARLKQMEETALKFYFDYYISGEDSLNKDVEQALSEAIVEMNKTKYLLIFILFLLVVNFFIILKSNRKHQK